MSHPSQLDLSMLADGALADADAQAITAHIEACEHCRRQYQVLSQEAQQLSAVMRLETVDVPVPKFSRPASLRGFAMANLATGLVIWLAQFLWKTLFGEVIVETTTWLTSVYLPDIYAMASGSFLYLLEEGTAMLDAYLVFVVLSVLALTGAALVFKYRQGRSVVSLCLAMGLTAMLVLPVPAAQALELQRDDAVITITAGEIIDDSLLVAAETVVIEGEVRGDLVAVGQSVDISGSVAGNVIAFAESVKIRGSVGGTVIGAAAAYNLSDARVGGDVWIAGEKVGLDDATQVARNATFAAQSVTVEGEVDKDVHAYAESVEINGTLGEDLEAFANRMRLLGDAEIGGDVRFRTEGEDKLYRAEGAQVGGDIEFLDIPEDWKPQNPFTTIEFYVWQIAQLIAAFLLGWALLSLIPGLANVTLAGGMEGLKSAGLGLLVMLAVPTVAVIVAITIIGLPFALIGFCIWLLGLYLSQIMIARVIGSSLVTNSLPLSLLVGLVIVLVAVNVPFLGDVFDFLFTIVGLGLLVQFLYRWFESSRNGSADTANV